jgi:hypothetical protein
MNEKVNLRGRVVRVVRLALGVVLWGATTGCDPIVNVYGSFFPAWVICIVIGMAVTVLLRWVFAAVKIERCLGPLVLVYPALAFLATCFSWLWLFGP